ncbi:MAG: hypothetical protein JNM32_11790 [Dechloromonas sp.]|nr:hypothetical protein [Dechloromonas sp.]
MTQAGRSCPLRYHYGARAIAKAPERSAETLYAVGGLYGNPLALDAVEAMAAKESGATTICFNGDFNWFNIDDAGFRAINERILRHDAILGNVEAELNDESGDAGCGCAYPDTVSHDVVERSNRIHATLKRTAARHPDLLAALGRLPMIARYRVGDLRVGVVHGDANALAGWRFDVDALLATEHQDWLASAFVDADVDVFASSHTCLPAMRCFDFGGVRLVANNGAAGMPNILGSRFGIVTRISPRPSPVRPLYGHQWNGHFVDALPLDYDHLQWKAHFLANWPPGSPAYVSYFERIVLGPNYRFDRAFCCFDRN